MAVAKQGETIFVEVKTWSAETWAIPGQTDKIIEQLRRHDGGIQEIMGRGPPGNTLAARVLMVEESGYNAGLWDVEKGNAFRSSVHALGWTIETIPSSQVRTFADLIDALR